MSKFARFVFALVAVCVASLSLPTFARQAAQFELKHLDTREAITALRAIAGVRQIEVVGDRALLVTEAEATLKVVEGVLELSDVKADASPDVESFVVVPGKDVVARVKLRKIQGADAMAALRRELSVRKIAASMKPSSLVLIRDTPEKCEAAQALIASLEAAAE